MKIFVLSEAAKTQMLQNTLDNVVEFQMICTTAQQTRHAVTGSKPHAFKDYKALMTSAADAYYAKRTAKRCPKCNAFLHNLGNHNSGVDYYDDRYDIDTTIDIIFANAARTHAGMIPNEHLQQMSKEGQKIWALLSDNDCLLVKKMWMQSWNICLTM